MTEAIGFVFDAKNDFFFEWAIRASIPSCFWPPLGTMFSSLHNFFTFGADNNDNTVSSSVNFEPKKINIFNRNF